MTAYKELGYKSYDSYLKSGLWKKIKKRVLVKHNYKCIVCGDHAKIVHHKFYSYDILKGYNIFPLVVICEIHHNEIHRGKKGVDEVNKSLQKLIDREKEKREEKIIIRIEPGENKKIWKKKKTLAKAIGVPSITYLEIDKNSPKKKKNKNKKKNKKKKKICKRTEEQKQNAKKKLEKYLEDNNHKIPTKGALSSKT